MCRVCVCINIYDVVVSVRNLCQEAHRSLFEGTVWDVIEILGDRCLLKKYITGGGFQSVDSHFTDNSASAPCWGRCPLQPPAVVLTPTSPYVSPYGPIRQDKSLFHQLLQFMVFYHRRNKLILIPTRITGNRMSIVLNKQLHWCIVMRTHFYFQIGFLPWSIKMLF